MGKQDEQGLDLVDREMLAEEAFAYALTLPPGVQRSDALKLASRLRCAADGRRPSPAGRGHPKKAGKCVP
jgi:hypothetical protein